MKIERYKSNHKLITFFLLIFIFNFAYAQESENNGQNGSKASPEKLAKQLANPIANLISIPFQNNYEFNVGPIEGLRYTLNVQPVIPISIGEN